MKSYGQKLGEVEEAISKVLINQSYTIDDKTFTRADLDALRKLEKEYTDKVNKFGFNYMPGQSQKPKRTSRVVFNQSL